MIPAASGVFFASGVAALLYQVIWQRLLVMFSGADAPSVTLIVAAFMGGLGVGHLAGGHVADRVSRLSALLLFAIAEIAVGVFGMISGWFFYDVLYAQLASRQISGPAMFAILFAVLLWPTFFMGASLPLLSRTLTSGIDRAARVIGLLYGVNTCGAAAGALVSTWWLLPARGLDGTLIVGAALNFACAVATVPLAVVLRRRDRAGSSSAAAERLGPPPDQPGAVDRAAYPPVVWAALFAFSGMVALSLEVVWFRVLGVIMKSTPFTFGTLLAAYLGGLGLGSLAGSLVAPRARRPVVAFLALQAGASLSAAVLLIALVRASDSLSWVRPYLEGHDALNIPEAVRALRAGVIPFGAPASEEAAMAATFVRVFVVMPALLIVPSTFLMGCSFPLLQRVIQTDLGRVARRVGVLLLANVAGSTIGTIVTGLVLLERAGTGGAITGVALAGGVFAVLMLDRLWRAPSPAAPARRAAAVALVPAIATLVVSSVVLMPDNDELWSHLHGTTAEQSVIVEDRSGVSLIKIDPTNAVVFVNGVSQSALPYGGLHTALGAIPALLHPAPRTAAVIGLGSGDTVHAVALRPETERVACIEIVAGQLRALKQLDGRRRFGGLHRLLNDPRISHIAGDGRIHLVRGEPTYDIIEADALQPAMSHSGALYSEEFFRLVGDRLRPNGLAVTWVPTRRVHNSFVRAFPHVWGVPGILVGSRDPIAIDRETVLGRAAHPAVRAHFAADGIDIVSLVASQLSGLITRYGPEYPRDSLTDFNSDRFPRDEFNLFAERR
jgi:spermidine synthase